MTILVKQDGGLQYHTCVRLWAELTAGSLIIIIIKEYRFAGASMNRSRMYFYTRISLGVFFQCLSRLFLNVMEHFEFTTFFGSSFQILALRKYKKFD